MLLSVFVFDARLVNSPAGKNMLYVKKCSFIYFILQTDDPYKS